MSDAVARLRIRDDLETNLLVEAGAGSGKTTCLVERMVNLIRRGDPVERIAAVTFTRKAANELRERFQLGLEHGLHNTSDGDERARFEVALRDLDSSFLGTIHAFCGRLLRERSLEAGLDPTFEEVDQDGLALLREAFFAGWLEGCRLGDDPALAELERLGIDPQNLAASFGSVVDNPDVRFPLSEAPCPDHSRCHALLGALLEAADELMPAAEPGDGWDALMRLVRRLRYRQRVGDWSEVAQFCAAIGTIGDGDCRPIQKRWGDTREARQAAKELGERFIAFKDGAAATLLQQWREHRYPAVIRFLERAAAAFARERRRAGRLGFQDLLMHAAELLRTTPTARTALGERYRRLLVDEFQDTDPIQAEVCLLLTSEVSEGNDWRTVRPRPGSLFVVGDPKQSIYRFRRADLETYGFVRERMEQLGAVLTLTRNFRSTAPIERFVNAFAASVLPPTETRHQAIYAPMQTVKVVEPADGVYRYEVPRASTREATLAADAGRLASWIASRIGTGERAPGDFLVLVQGKRWIAAYAEALAARNIAVTTTGAQLPQERELGELRLLLESLADPGNPLLVAAVLEGLFFGFSPADLYAAAQRGIAFTALHAPNGTGPVAAALETLHRWCGDVGREPADLLLERILDETGLLPYAASQALGDGRAGTLLRLVETIRAAAAGGATALTDAIDAIDRALAADGSASLRPGRSDAVRVMNLHQAKGLEARVVVLAAPLPAPQHEPELHVSRTAEGAEGGMAVVAVDGELLAHPAGWDMMQAEESLFLEAEADRLRYVAATRAEHELLVAQLVHDGERADTSVWAPFAETLEAHASRRELPVSPAPGRIRLGRTLLELRDEVDAADRRRHAAGAESFCIEVVTRSAKLDRVERESYDLAAAPAPHGRAWGTAVHRGIEAMGRGRSGESLHRFLRAVVRDERLAVDAAEIAAAVERLEVLLARVRLLPEWEARQAVELPVMRVDVRAGVTTVREGIVDLLAGEGDRYRVLDWKSDRAGDAAWRERLPHYLRQVEAYTSMLAGLGLTMEEGRIEHLA